MNTNKGIKILRIVSLSLGIISMLFFLYTKICHAESQQVPFPNDIPYRPSWDYSPFKDNATAQNNLVNSAKQALADKGYNNNPDFMLAFASYNENDHLYTVRVWFNAGKNGNMYEYGTYQMHDWLSDNATRCGYISEQGTIYVTSTGELYSNSIGQAPSANSFQWVYTSEKTGKTMKIGEVNGAAGVVYSTTNVYDITGSDMNSNTNIITIAKSGLTTEEIIEAQITGIFENTELIAQAGSQTTDTLDTLKQSTLKGWLQAIIDSIWKSANNKVQNLTSFFSPTFKFWTSIWSHIKDKIDGLVELITAIKEILQESIGNDLTAGGIQNEWITDYQQSDIYTLVNVGTGIKNSLSNLGQAEPQAPRIIVNFGNNTFFGNLPEYEFSWLWYENNRTVITTFITAFWLVGLGIHLATQIPNMIRGVSGSAHGIQNAVQPTEVHKDIFH